MPNTGRHSYTSLRNCYFDIMKQICRNVWQDSMKQRHRVVAFYRLVFLIHNEAGNIIYE